MNPPIAGHTSYTGLMIYATLAAVGVGFVLLTNWPTYYHLIHGGPALFWYYLIICALVIPIFFAEPGVCLRFTRDSIFWWTLVFLISGVLWLLLAQDFIEDAGAVWRSRLAAFGLFYAIGVLCLASRQSVIAWLIVGCMIIACASTWFDVLRPYRFVPRGDEFSHVGRGSGLFINPNIAASFLAMATIAVLPFIPMRFRGLLILGAVVGIVPTFSRSGFLYAALLLIGPIVLRLLNRGQTAFLLIVTPALVAMGAASYDFLMSSSDDANLHNVVRRLEWFQGVADEDQAVEGRSYGAQHAWQMFLAEPLAGQGLGATRIESTVHEGPHNMYLMFMAEQGFFGLALYPALLAILLRVGRRLKRSAVTQQGVEIGNTVMLYAVFLFAYGFFSHNVFEEPHGMFVMAFIAAAAFRAPRAEAVWAREPAVRFRQPQAAVGAGTRVRQT